MPTFPAPVARAFAGLVDGSGRTVVISGPPMSGKSALLEELEGQLTASGHHVVTLKGEYRERNTPFAALARLDLGAEPVDEGPDDSPAPQGEASDLEDSGFVPPPYALVDMEPTSSRRGRGGRRETILGHAVLSRSRAVETRDPRDFWNHLVDRFRAAPERGLAILVEDAVYVDSESRDFLLFLGERARLRPLLLVYALDSGTPTYGAWEERLIGRGDVDWVKFARSKSDPREVHRFKEEFDRLPEVTQKMLGYTALMGGHVSEVSLSRVARMTWRQLADALLPATEAKLAKIDAAKVQVPHDAWVQVLPDLFPEDVRREMHHEIAEALAALNPEPNLVRRLELASHYYEWYHGPNALRYLLEAAELTEHLFAFDTATEVLEKALACIPSLPMADRPDAEAELRMYYARVLLAAGRPTDAAEALREGTTTALSAHLPPERLEEWIERALPLLRAAGPRPALETSLVEIADRCHDAGATTAEVLLQSILASYEVDRNRPEKARREATRAVATSRSIGAGPVQAVALLAVALAYLEGDSPAQGMADKFLKAAETMLGAARRYELQQLAEEIHVRLLEAKGDRAAALRAHERGVPLAQRVRSLATELTHQLGIVQLLIDQRTDARVVAALKRAHEITELLHLLPPSPDLIRLWLLEGRLHLATGTKDAARDRWEAIADHPSPAIAPRLRAEALARLAHLEASDGRDERARRYAERLRTPELAAVMQPAWAALIADVPASRSAAGATPGPVD